MRQRFSIHLEKVSQWGQWSNGGVERGCSRMVGGASCGKDFASGRRAGDSLPLEW